MTDLLRGQARGPLQRAKRRFVRTLVNVPLRWTQSCPRTGGVLYAGRQYTARGKIRRLAMCVHKSVRSFLNIHSQKTHDPTAFKDRVIPQNQQCFELLGSAMPADLTSQIGSEKTSSSSEGLTGPLGVK